MKLRELKVPFGLKGGRLYSPDEVPNGLACECRCPSPGCNARLRANHPEDRSRRRAYFSHHNAEECSGGYESALHKMAIQIVYEAGWVKAPGKTYHGKTHIAGNYSESWTVTLSEQPVTFKEVVYEKNTSEGLRPDLTATLADGTRLNIEIFVTHPVKPPKAQALDNLMEIDLSDVPRDQVADSEKLKQIVLRKAHRTWYRCSWMDEQLENSPAMKALAEKHRQDKKQYLTQRRASEKERREHEENLKALDESRRKEREPYLDDISKALRLAEPGSAEEFRSLLRERCDTDVKSTQRRMETLFFTQTGCPVHGSEVATHGDWIVKTDPLIWKAYVMKDFIFKAESGKSFTAGRVVNEVQKWFGFWPWVERLAEIKRRDNDLRKTWQPRLLSDLESASIILPVEAMAAFLDRLTGRPYGYLEEMKGGHQYIVRYRNPLSLQADYFAQKNGQ